MPETLVRNAQHQRAVPPFRTWEPNVVGEKDYPSELESMLLGISNVADVIVTGEPNPITGNVVHAQFNLLRSSRIPQARQGLVPEGLAPFKILERFVML
jgi:acyl-coenzyme A synthetase/AMP-(fatty) acid ligase